MLRVLRGALGHVPPLVRSAQATARPVFQMSVRGMHRVQKRIYPHVSQKAGYSYRKSMMKNMLTSLIEHERIKTTLAKAKELSSLADKMVTRGKRGDLNSHRVAKANVRNRWCLAKLFTIFAERYRDREGGYTRVLKTYPRAGDAAEMAYVEMVDRPVGRMPRPLPEQPTSVMPGRGGRSFRAGKRVLNDEIR